MATLEDAELYLADVERSIADLKYKYDGKQNERVLSAHVWMTDQITQYIHKVTLLRDSVTTIKDKHVGDFKSSTQFDGVLNYCNNLVKLLNELNFLYKTRANFVDIRMKLSYSLPQLSENIKHIRNRFNIIKGQVSKKPFEYEERDSWF